MNYVKQRKIYTAESFKRDYKSYKFLRLLYGQIVRLEK